MYTFKTLDNNLVVHSKTQQPILEDTVDPKRARDIAEVLSKRAGKKIVPVFLVDEKRR